MAIRIITDSTSDLGLEAAAQLGVDILPLTVLFGEQAYRDNIDITNREFYEKLAAAPQLPTTSQVTPAAFEELFSQYIQQGDEIVVISIASQLSGTFQSACIAKEMIGFGSIHLVDSKNATAAQGLLVHYAVKMRRQGASAGEIAEKLREMSDKLVLIAMVDTLKYLKMGGRISAATAAIGGMLGIKPIIALQDGVIQTIGKAKGQKAAIQWMAEKLTSDLIPDPQYGVAFAHSNAPEGVQELKSAVLEKISAEEISTSELGSVIGTHGGPGCLGIAFVAQ